MPLELACSHRQSQSACTVRASWLAPNQLGGGSTRVPPLSYALLQAAEAESRCAPPSRKGGCRITHWTGTAQATSLPDKDAAHCNKRLILFSLDFPARQGCRRPRSSRIPYPKRHGGIVRRTRTLDLAPPKQKKRNSHPRGGRLATERQRSPEDGKIYARCMV